MVALRRLVLAAALTVAWHTQVAAGSAGGGEPRFEAAQIIALAKRVEKEVAARGARVALIARVGRSPQELPDGIEFTHVAFAVYSRIDTADGRTLPGYAVYNLYQDDDAPDTSYLLQDYALDYFAPVFQLKAGVIIPTPVLQQRLLEVIGSEVYVSLHNPHNSAISNPFDTRYQNCTEFVLDVLNAAIYRTGDVRRIKANLATYFEPEPIRVSSLELVMGSMFKRDIFITDHPGAVRTATFHSIERYMRRHGLAQDVFVVSVD